MRRLIASLILVFLVATAVVSLTKEIVIRHWVREGFQDQLNLLVKTQEIYISLLRPRLTFEGLYVLNPSAFGDQWLTNVSDVVIDYDISDLFRRKFRIKQMKLDILEINIVKNAKGEINLNSIGHNENVKAKHLDLSIENLDLSIRRVTYQDLSMDIPVKVYDLNIKDLKFQNIESLNALSRLVAVKVLERIGLNQLGLNGSGPQDSSKSSGPLVQAGSFLEEVIRSIRQALPA